MNQFINNLLSVIAVLGLIILLLLLFAVLMEYIRMFWMRHKIRKSCKQMENYLKHNKQLFEDGKEKEFDEAMKNILKENGIDVIDENNDDLY